MVKLLNLSPRLKKGEYNGSDKYPRTARRYRFEEIESPKIVNIDLSADIQKAFDNAKSILYVKKFN